MIAGLSVAAIRAAGIAAAACMLVAGATPSVGPLARAAAVGEWQPIGPSAQDVLAVAASPRQPALLLASTRAAGLLASADGGSHWRAAGAGLPPGVPVDWLSPAAGSGGLALALAGGTPYLSADGGAHWQRSAAGLPSGAGLTVGWLGSGDPPPMLAGGVASLFRSDDGGRLWRRSDAGLPATGHITFIAASPSDPHRLLAGVSYRNTHGGRVFLSTNGGLTWKEMDRGLAVGAVPWQGVWSATQPDAAWVVAGTVFGTVDGGRHWRRDGFGLPSRTFAQSMARLADGSLAVALPGVLAVRRPDRTAWSLVPAPWSSTALVHQLAAMPNGGLLAATGDGLFGADAAGRIWRDLGIGMPSRASIYALAAGPDAGTLYAGDEDGVWQYGAGGIWATTGPGIPVGADVRDLLVLPGPPPRLLCATEYGVYVSSAAFDSWRIAPGPPVGRPVGALAYAAATDTVYAALEDGGIYEAPAATLDWHLLPGSLGLGATRMLLADQGGAWLLTSGARSGDGGRTWLPAPRGIIAALRVQDQPGTVLVGTLAHGLLRSTDGGAHWTRVASGVSSSAIVPALAELPAGDSSLLYAVADGLLISSQDAGLTWRALTHRAPGAPITSLQVLPGSPIRLLAGTAGAGVLAYDIARQVPASLRTTRTATPTPTPGRSAHAATATRTPPPATAPPTRTPSPTPTNTPRPTPKSTPSPTATRTALPATPVTNPDTPVPPLASPSPTALGQAVWITTTGASWSIGGTQWKPRPCVRGVRHGPPSVGFSPPGLVKGQDRA